MKILGKRILIEPVTAIVSSGGIHLPQSSQLHSMEGIVMAIGSGLTESRPYQKGSHVFVEMYKSGPESALGVKGKDCFLVEHEAICGVMVGLAFHPIGDNILLKPTKVIDSTKKLIRPSAYEDDADALIPCTVHLLGSGIKSKKGVLKPFTVKIGDEVLIEPFCGRDVDTSEGTYKLVKESDVKAVLYERDFIN